MDVLLLLNLFFGEALITVKPVRLINILYFFFRLSLSDSNPHLISNFCVCSCEGSTVVIGERSSQETDFKFQSIPFCSLWKNAQIHLQL